MSSTEKYRRFCQTAPDLPIFMQDWYLDAVCEDGAWEAVLVEKNGRVVAALPFFLKKKWGSRYVAMPPLTKMLGPYALPECRDPRQEHPIFAELIAQLPRLAAFEQDCNYHFQDWLPFYWQGFRQTTRYSYTLEINDLEAVRKNIVPDFRNQKMKRAAAAVRIRTGGDLPEFFRVHNLSFERQGLSAPVSFDFLKKLDAALAAHSAREIFFAEDLQTGAVHSVAYLIWDARSAYLLLAGDDPALRESGAGILLTWEAIRYASQTLGLPVFDFAGSMKPSIERVRRQFGAVPKPYFRLQKEWSWMFRVGKALLR